jgi:hypothetical protein
MQQFHDDERLSPTTLTESFQEIRTEKNATSPSRANNTKRASYSFNVGSLVPNSTSPEQKSQNTSRVADVPQTKNAALTAAAQYANRLFKGGFSMMHSHQSR